MKKKAHKRIQENNCQVKGKIFQKKKKRQNNKNKNKKILIYEIITPAEIILSIARKIPDDMNLVEG